MSDRFENKTIWQSYVFHGDKAFFVSTIERQYEVYGGYTTGLETMAWEWNPKTRERGEMLYGSGDFAAMGVSAPDHGAICRCLIASGEMPDADNPAHSRFFR